MSGEENLTGKINDNTDKEQEKGRQKTRREKKRTNPG